MSSEPSAALTHRIIGAAIKVHRALGPGLLERVYQQCLCWEFEQAGIGFEAELRVPVTYADVTLPQAYVADFVVEGAVLVELKSVEQILPIHSAQVLTYLRLSQCSLGLLLNFNVTVLKNGVRRFVRHSGVGGVEAPL